MYGTKATKWKESMKSGIQSMYDNQVWSLVNPTSDIKTVGCKWIFNNKTDMDGNVYTFKYRLVVKGYTQTQGINCKETFLQVSKIKSIIILLTIYAYDYGI